MLIEISSKNIVLSVVISLLIPYFIGVSICYLLKLEKYHSRFFMVGSATVFALIQLFAVPSIFLQVSFSALYYIVVLCCAVLAVFGAIILFIKRPFSFKGKKALNTVLTLIAIVFCLWFLNKSVHYQHIDEDDSRFVVNAVDMLEKNTMFLSDPSTGERLDFFTLHDSFKDAVSPWAVYLATVSRFTGISVVSMAHTIMPISLMLLAMCTWWSFIGVFTKNDSMYQSMFLILMLLFALNVNWGSGETVLIKFMVRLWQGKAVVASSGIPMMYLALFDFYEKSDAGTLFEILIFNLAICLMSANGIVIGAVMIGVFSLAYAVIKKKYSIMIKLLPMAIPNGLYYVISTIIKSFRIM